MNTESTHVFFVHSPITYSIARATIDALRLNAPILIGGRSIAGPDIAVAVNDDGQWSIEATCRLLASMLERIPPNSIISLYVPHTAFLFGRLIKASSRVHQIYYLEEGFTSADMARQQLYRLPQALNADALDQALHRYDLYDRLGIAASALAVICKSPLQTFDAGMDTYAGCFACSPDAFPSMPLVTHLTLQPSPVRRKARLLSLHGFRNQWDDPNLLEQAYRATLKLCTHLVKNGRDAIPLVVKLHPRDAMEPPDWFGRSQPPHCIAYADYCRDHQLNPNVEPALLNFEHYVVVGKSSQSKYVTQFLGSQRLTRIESVFKTVSSVSSG